MILKDELLREHSRVQMLHITHYIGSNPKRFAELMTIFTTGPYHLTQRAAWPLSYCVEKYPELLGKHLPTLVQHLKNPAHNAVTRNILRLLQFVDIPEKEAGDIMDICFSLLTKPKEPVANKAFSLTVLANLSEHYPDIRQEILLCIADQMPRASPGFKARAKKVMKLLEKKA